MSEQSMDERFRPLGKRVLVRPVEPEEVTTGGIILPQDARQVPRNGTVVSIGTESVWRGDVQEGDVVVYTSYGGHTLKIEEEEYVVLGEDDILGVLA